MVEVAPLVVSACVTTPVSGAFRDGACPIADGADKRVEMGNAPDVEWHELCKGLPERVEE